MARFSLEQKTEKKSKPADIYLKFKSGEKGFEGWNHKANEKVLIDEPFKFAVVSEYHTVSGYNNQHRTGVFSNEVQHIGKDPLIIRTWKPEGNIVAEGIWKETKPVSEAQGGYYTKSIYAVHEDGTPINLQVSRSAVQAWSAFCKDFGGGYDNPNFNDHWVEFSGVQEMKNGSINYCVPIFSVGKKFTAKQDEMIMAQAKDIENYMKAYFSVVEEPELETDGLDF